MTQCGRNEHDFIDDNDRILNPHPTMRIACLLPSATDICVALGLADSIVGVTHECDLESVVESQSQSDYENGSNKVHILTSSGFDDGQEHSQDEIDARVKTESKLLNASAESINSLYPICKEAFHAARPTVVITQDLCSVCAPCPKDVNNMLREVGRGMDDDEEVQVYSLDPHSLMDVADTFVAVAEICGVPERGRMLKDEFVSNLNALKDIATKQRDSDGNIRQKKVLLFEWLDPPYDGGHWIPDMIEIVGCEVAKVGNKLGSKKSKQFTWDDVYTSDPDIVLVACCGFDLERNKKDAISASSKLRPMRAAQNERVYACNGDLNFARPGPKLLGGAAAIARCAFDGDKDVVRALEGLTFMKSTSFEWERVPIDLLKNGTVCDIEDIADMKDFDAAHKAACDNGKMTYTDPDSGYEVFTELAHKNRGKCCGSGCRHCPFNHKNVKDKASKIKQPAFLYEGEGRGALKKTLHAADNVKILFFSGGKDSYLAIRALYRKYYQNDKSFALILLTTFDSVSRTIAHQEVHINNVIKQATHLNLPLIGVPMHRGSSEPYVKRIRRAVNLVSEELNCMDKISSLCFGDLHLEHIRSWRESEVSKLGFELEYPIWKLPYVDLVLDLEKSGADIVVSASTEIGVQVGDVFDKFLSQRAEKLGMDGFGENGEFHSLAKVWVVSRDRALGLE